MSSHNFAARARPAGSPARFLIAAAVLLCWAAVSHAQNVTQLENAKAGTTDWQIDYKSKGTPSVSFLSDRHFMSGSPATYAARAIAGTPDGSLYLDVRYSFNDFGYKLPAKNGTYTLKLHFAECWFGVNAAGTRLFHVDVNGQRKLSNFNISAEAPGGPNRAVVKTFSGVSVTDGGVAIDFVNVQNGPVVAAIELIPDDPAGTVTRIDAGGYGDAALSHEIEGYASHTSVNRGEQIDLFVNTSDPSYTIDVYRMGWYGGAGARKVAGPISRTGVTQVVPSPDASTGFLECAWTGPYHLTVPNNPSDPTDWASGVYLAKLTASGGKQSYIIFVVRDDARASDLLYQSSFTTYQAYNSWGGKSLYPSPLSTSTQVTATNSSRAAKVSFNRPYAPNVFKPEAAAGAGAGEFLTNAHEQVWVLPAGWEYNTVRFLEREGYDVTYSTNVDTHANPNLLLNHKAFLSVGHDEYWSWEMRSNVEAARNRTPNPVNLAFLGSNAAYWQIRLEPSGVNGAASRTMVCYKYKGNAAENAVLGDANNTSSDDPFYADQDSSNNNRVTVRWRDPFLGSYSEDRLVGVRYVHNPVDADLIINNQSHWVLRGTDLSNGAALYRLLGVEADERGPGSPVASGDVIAASPYPVPTPEPSPSPAPTTKAHMTTYAAAGSGATVFGAGTMVWGWGLDDYNKEIMGRVEAGSGRPGSENLVNPSAQWMMRNVLANFAGLPCPSTGETVWAEEGLPQGAASVTGTYSSGGFTWTNETWGWASDPRPYAKTLSARSGLLPGAHQLYFDSATSPLVVNTGDKLIAYVYLDPHNPPTEVMLQWTPGSSDWEHRAYWGADQIPWGTGNTNGRRFKGALPPAGQWARLEVSASEVGLEGSSLTGMALTLYGGRANWDHIGKLTPPAPGKCS
jgi:hypothetical protein